MGTSAFRPKADKHFLGCYTNVTNRNFAGQADALESGGKEAA